MTHDALIEMDRTYMRTAERVMRSAVPSRSDLQTLRSLTVYLRTVKADWRIRQEAEQIREAMRS